MTTKKQNVPASTVSKKAEIPAAEVQANDAALTNPALDSGTNAQEGGSHKEPAKMTFTADLKPINEAIRNTLTIDSEARKATITIGSETFEIAESALRGAAIEGLIRILSADTAGRFKDHGPDDEVRRILGNWKDGYYKSADRAREEKKMRELLATKSGSKKLPFGRTEILGELRDNLPPLTDATKGIHAAYASLEKLDDDKFALVVESGKVPALVKVIESLTVKATEKAKLEAAKVEALASEFEGLDF